MKIDFYFVTSPYYNLMRKETTVSSTTARQDSYDTSPRDRRSRYEQEKRKGSIDSLGRHRRRSYSSDASQSRSPYRNPAKTPSSNRETSSTLLPTTEAELVASPIQEFALEAVTQSTPSKPGFKSTFQSAAPPKRKSHTHRTPRVSPEGKRTRKATTPPRYSVPSTPIAQEAAVVETVGSSLDAISSPRRSNRNTPQLPTSPYLGAIDNPSSTTMGPATSASPLNSSTFLLSPQQPRRTRISLSSPPEGAKTPTLDSLRGHRSSKASTPKRTLFSPRPESVQSKTGSHKTSRHSSAQPEPQDGFEPTEDRSRQSTPSTASTFSDPDYVLTLEQAHSKVTDGADALVLKAVKKVTQDRKKRFSTPLQESLTDVRQHSNDLTRTQQYVLGQFPERAARRNSRLAKESSKPKRRSPKPKD